MDIFLHNTLSGKKEIFKPLVAGQVSMYNCGPTVYDFAHIGNLRSYVFADVLRRTFEYNGYNVRQIINITDIGHLISDADDGDDKMTKALKRENKPLTLLAMRQIADFYFAEFKNDLAKLNIELPTEFPFASDNIKEDVDLILKLTEKNFTYKTSDGIYFDTAKFPEYGKLGNIRAVVDEHSRIGVNTEKKNYRDFAIWKFNTELGYDTPFGKGFPGWHIECSAMSVKFLGPEFDIHTGGIDHIPVHHNNEIAQSVCAGYPYAHYWLHNAHLNMGESKMAKSGDGFITLKTLGERGIDPLALRYIFLTARYSTSLQFSWESLEGANSALKKLHEKISNLPDGGTAIKSEFNELINDDLDTPKGLALVWDILKNDDISDADKKATVINYDKVLGLELDKTSTFEIPENIKKLVAERDKARAGSDFTKSDQLRAEIEKAGFSVKDTSDGAIISPV